MKSVNFEVLKEKWNEYNLKDGSTIKTRLLLNSVFYDIQDKKRNYTIDFQQTTTVVTPLMGTPDTTSHTLEDMKSNIETHNCPYETISYEVNEYYLDGNATLLINTNVSNIARTSLYDKNGSRVYIVEITSQMQMKPFKSN